MISIAASELLLARQYGHSISNSPAVGMTLRDRLTVIQTSAKSAGTRIASLALIISGAFLGVSSVEVISKWQSIASRPRVAVALILFLGTSSIAICSWALQQLRAQSTGRSGPSAGVESEYEGIF